MCTYGVVRHQLVSDLFGERGVKAATDVDCREFITFAFVVRPEFRVFTCEVGLFGVSL
jgi:hypothetical protein